jgi:hypothetical protein
MASDVLGCESFLLSDPSRLHPTGSSLILGPSKVGTFRLSLAAWFTFLPWDPHRADVLSAEIAVEGPGRVTGYLPLDLEV